MEKFEVEREGTKDKDVVTFGETMIVFNPDEAGPLRYVDTFRKSIGGAESNVAIALARLGHKVGWFSKLGEDAFGKTIECVVRGEGVDVSRVKFDSSRSTGLLFKEHYAKSSPNVYYYRKNSAASSLSVEDLDDEYIKSSKILHITGITPALSEDARKAVFRAIEIARKNKVLVSFDPNIRLKLWSVEEAGEILLQIAGLSDIIFPGIDEGRLLLGLDKPENIAKAFLDMGCKTAIVKLGAEGCYAAQEEERVYVKGYKVEKIEDTVGAGDGFAAGFLSGILRGLTLKECGEFANGVGAMALLVKGDMEGYPDYNQLMEFIGKKHGIDR